MEYWVASIGIPSAVLTNNRTQFTSKVFAALCKKVGVKTVATIKCHQQACGQVDRFNVTMMSRLSYYAAKHQKNWDTFLFPLKYVYNVQVHRTTKMLPISLSISRLPPKPILTARPMPPEVDDIDSPIAYRLCLMHRAVFLKKMTDVDSKKAQARYEKGHDRHVCIESRFAAGGYLFGERSLLLASAADRMFL